MYADWDIDIDGRYPNGNFPEEDRYNSGWQCRDSYDYAENTPPQKVYKYQFQTEEELITSEIFQKCLGQSLAHKERQIASLRNELLKPYWARD